MSQQILTNKNIKKIKSLNQRLLIWVDSFKFIFQVKKNLNSKGLSLVEALVSIAILMGTIAASTKIMNQIQQNRKYSEHLVALAITRNNIIHWLNNRPAWENMVFYNANLSCLQDRLDCNGTANSPIDILAMNYDGTATGAGVIYKTTDPAPNMNGLTLFGGVANFGAGQPNRIGCQGYNAVTTNLNCPIRLNLNWQMVTDQVAAPFVYPSVLIQGRFQTPADNQMRIPSLETLNFNFRVPFSYCKNGDPALGNFPQAVFQAPAVANIVYVPALPGIPTRIRNTNAGPNNIDNATVTGLEPCHKLTLNFIDIGDASPPPGPACNINNACSKICVGPVGNPCQYEYRKYFSAGATTFSLFQKNNAAAPSVLVYTKPAGLPMTGVELSKFIINKGIAQFYYIDRIVQTFTVGVRDSFQFQFYPGAKAGVNGQFNSIQFNYGL